MPYSDLKTLNMKRSFIIIISCILAYGCSPKNEIPVENPQKVDSTSSFSIEGKKVSIFTTASNSELRLENTGTKELTTAQQPTESDISIFVNPNKQFQTFLGIGGAITDASAEVFAKLPETKQEELLTAYYDKKNGIGYSLLRASIHSCDFSSESFTYVTNDDKELKSFNIEHDYKNRIPLIKKLLKQQVEN